MIAYRVQDEKVWKVDEADGETIPAWCKTKEGYHIVDKLPTDVQALVDAQNAEKQAKEDATQRKSKGEPYTALSDEPISFTKDDALGMLQVKTAFELGLKETVFHFSNGTKLNIKAKDFTDFAIWFTQKRAAFFAEK